MVTAREEVDRFLSMKPVSIIVVNPESDYTDAKTFEKAAKLGLLPSNVILSKHIDIGVVQRVPGGNT